MTTVSNDNQTTLADYRADLDAELASASVQGFWTTAMKNDWINRAGQRICSYYRWPFLELAVYTQTRDGKEFYSYPKGDLRFKPNSIYQIHVDGEDYGRDQQGRLRLNWEQFIQHKQSEMENQVFANHNGFYFLNPIPENGKEMVLYGLKGWQKLVDDADTPITPVEFDEAIVRIAKAFALRKAKQYSEATAELADVLNPQVGILAQLKMDIENEASMGNGGEAKSSRWL